MKTLVAPLSVLFVCACMSTSPTPVDEAEQAAAQHSASPMAVEHEQDGAAVAATEPEGPAPGELVVHEWGTFTTRVDKAGNLLTWTAADRVEPLPRFVAQSWTTPAKQQARGTVRMETPVLYFYTDQPTRASATVEFPGGFLTEWYPTAFHEDTAEQATLRWSDFAIEPGPDPEFAVDGDSHYYAARETDAAPLAVDGPSGIEREKLLFYRGVGSFALPLDARVTARGMEVSATTRLAGVIVFRRAERKLGFTVVGELEGNRELPVPELTGQLEQLKSAMQQLLVEQGLYEREAAAMLATWEKLWFEDGLRVLYMVPRELTDRTLPLTLEPAPDELVRVLVGRLDLPPG